MEEDNQKTSRDGLDEYIQVSSPGLMIIIGALSLVLVATLVWGFTGKLPVTLTVTGCLFDAKDAAYLAGTEGDDIASKMSDNAWVVCFVDSSKYTAEQLARFDDDVTISMPDHTTLKGKIELLSPIPMSEEEALKYLGESEWLAEQCLDNDYSWGVAIHVQGGIPNHMFAVPQVTIITDEVPPIRFLAR